MVHIQLEWFEVENVIIKRNFNGIAELKLSNGTIIGFPMDINKLVSRLQMTTCSVLMMCVRIMTMVILKCLFKS